MTAQETTPKSAHDRAHQVRAQRYVPTPVYALAEQLQREGVALQTYDGPWRSTGRLLRRPGRNAERTIPIVTNGIVEIAVDTAEHAADLSGFLNSSGLHHLNPVPNLRPPTQDLLATA
jgi:hypothetical protein